MKKRIWTGALVFVLALSLLAGCGGDDKKGNSDEDAVIYDYDYGDLSEYITLGEYKGIEYTPAGKLIVKSGDTVSVSYVGRMDGEEFEGGTGTNNNLVIGSGSFIDGFESGLVGAKPGEERVLNLTFPDPYENNPDFAGKPVEFTATVNSVNGYETSADLDEANVWNTFFEGCEVIKYPEKELNGMIAQQREYYETMAQNYGVEFDKFLEAMSMDQEQFDAQIEEYCKQMVAQDMALYALARKENITTDDESIAEAKQTMIEAQGAATEEEFEKTYGVDLDSESVKNSIETTALLHKTLDFLLENAKPIGGSAADGTADDTEADGAEAAGDSGLKVQSVPNAN